MLADRDFSRAHVFQVSAGPDRALALAQNRRCVRFQQQAVQNTMAMGRHHNQADVSVTSRLHDLVGRIASEQFTGDHNAIEF
jgi:hypothetical protein